MFLNIFFDFNQVSTMKLTNKNNGFLTIINKKEQKTRAPASIETGAPLAVKRRRLPTLPHCIAVPSAMAGLTSLFG
ncbi:MAG: hypothetical protein J6X46_08090, partial [Prevotella sp.]|nr:hypothetical protein [Prevotella sp.]